MRRHDDRTANTVGTKHRGARRWHWSLRARGPSRWCCHGCRRGEYERAPTFPPPPPPPSRPRAHARRAGEESERKECAARFSRIARIMDFVFVRKHASKSMDLRFLCAPLVRGVNDSATRECYIPAACRRRDARERCEDFAADSWSHKAISPLQFVIQGIQFLNIWVLLENYERCTFIWKNNPNEYDAGKSFKLLCPFKKYIRDADLGL